MYTILIMIEGAQTRRNARLPQSRPPLARMMVIHEDLVGERAPNCSQLARRLEVSSKTVQRDIEFMRDQLLLPIEYDSSKRGYRYTRKVDAFPGLPVSEGELLALFVARNALASYEGTSLGDTLRAAFDRLTARMSDNVVFEWEALATRVSFQQSKPAGELLVVFDAVKTAVLNTVRLRFLYKGLKDTRMQERTVHPYQVRFVDGGWYLLAWDESRRDWRVFSLHRMERVAVLSQHFDRDPSFSSDTFWQDTLGVYREGEPVKVVLRFRGWAARLVTERRWHPSQGLKACRNGESELTLRVQLTPELTRWVLSWGSAVIVWQPKALRDEVAKELMDAAAVYSE